MSDAVFVESLVTELNKAVGGGKRALQKVTALESRVGTLEGAKPTATIKQTWRSGDNWWRQYSDGAIEQGGELTIGFNSNWQATLSFHKAFSTTTYFVNWVCVDNKYDGYYQHSTPSKRTSNATIVEIHRSGNVKISWVAFGY